SLIRARAPACGTPATCPFVCRRLSFLRHGVELPRWCCQRTALHLNSLEPGQLTPMQTRSRAKPPGRTSNGYRINGGSLADSGLSRVNAVPANRGRPLSRGDRYGLISPNHVATRPDNGRG